MAHRANLWLQAVRKAWLQALKPLLHWRQAAGSQEESGKIVNLVQQLLLAGAAKGDIVCLP